jgi:hypothetical protein
MDVVTDRLFRHLAWANNYVFDRIAEQPDEHLKLCAPNNATQWGIQNSMPPNLEPG